MARGRLNFAPPQPKEGGTQRDTTGFVSRRWLNLTGRLLTGFWMSTAAAITALDVGLVHVLERQSQSLFFEMRGVVTPPALIVILKIDENSLNQQQFYRDNPDRRAYLEPIQHWPWKRVAYARVVEKLLAAGAKSVSLDLVFDTPSSYGQEDDWAFAQVLQRYGDRIVLAAQYSFAEAADQGATDQLITPIPILRPETLWLGSINYFIETNGKMHQLGSQVVEEHQRNLPVRQAQAFRERVATVPDFATATLQSAGVSYPTPKGTTIFFYGPGQTFQQVSFVDVLDPDTWEKQFQSGQFFQDKIVIIGSTATILQDFHATPFGHDGSLMAGIEIHANAIASLLEGRTIVDVIPSAPVKGVFVLCSVVLAAWWSSRPKQPLHRWCWGMGLAIAWMGIGYVSFIYGGLIIPTAIPVGAIALTACSLLLTGTAREQMRKRQLRAALQQYVTSPIVQEIISQQEDLQDLLRDRELALAGKLLSHRYCIIRVLGSGGFSETYVAEDTQRPGNPLCVVKQLRVANNNLHALKMARRLFATEAETLEKLGQHDQIPHLLACFEENEEFYLVQEFIPGHPLSRELLPHYSLIEPEVIKLLYELLHILEFVHHHGVIHRDLKPSNIIRRQTDGKLVLIDFGIAKKITTQLATAEHNTKFTVAVGTPGYMPGEQAAGRPSFNSDIYALGMIGIQALTGTSPHLLQHDTKTGEILWHNPDLQVSPAFATILDKMVQQDFTQRYLSAQEVREALERLPGFAHANLPTAPTFDSSLFESFDLEQEEDTNTSYTVALPDDWSQEKSHHSS